MIIKKIRLLKPFVIYGLLVFFTYLMLLITLQYVPLNFNAAFLVTKQTEIKLIHYQLAFFVHVYTSIFTIIFGMFQFSLQLRIRYPRLHRIVGRLYVLIILFFSAPSGFVMGYYGNGGISSRISFCLLAVLWFYFTLKAFLSIRDKKFKKHEYYMHFSYALTLSAISLRLFKWIIANTLELPPMDTYHIVVWLGWIFNLFVALLVIRRKQIIRNKYLIQQK